ncbi:hypothetical protein [Catellatospora chokoriensis]|uniref:Uncharacterized protein n=1 Tax=Catellatospora chokoriensis TaxID=310353 RepID=A0A8J3K0X3_9ACTN|nr:hypothetical protein [Catellatospora chokoriensis]GIF92039.1 hypothetical protein Cch02nite_54830 [Catellatospora chokoriensis]
MNVRESLGTMGFGVLLSIFGFLSVANLFGVADAYARETLYRNAFLKKSGVWKSIIEPDDADWQAARRWSRVVGRIFVTAGIVILLAGTGSLIWALV